MMKPSKYTTNTLAKRENMKSFSPYNEVYHLTTSVDDERENIYRLMTSGPKRKTVVIQGLGFVGAAMLAVVASAKDLEGNPLYNVIGVDLADEDNYWKIGMVNEFKPPIVSSDKQLTAMYLEAGRAGNLYATYSDYAYQVADIVVVDIHLDIQKATIGDVENVKFSYAGFLNAITLCAQRIREGTLVLIETTVPPGTTEKVVYPLLRNVFSTRGLNPDRVCLAHSYERVTPGANYIDSINNFYRVYSGVNPISKSMAKEFLESIINTKDFPLSELKTTNASEMAKVLENSYRAANIAFIQEWTEFAEKCEVDLFEVIHAIRKRPTHRNIMLPGFGVGGYCLTKDALLADWAYKNTFDGASKLKFSTLAIQTNDLMPRHSFDLIKDHYRSLEGVQMAVLGVSYLKDVGDTRYTPTEYFYRLCAAEKAELIFHDPMIELWKETNIRVCNELSSLSELDIKIVVVTVQHDEYLNMTYSDYRLFFPNVELIVDANNCINDDLAYELHNNGVTMVGVGKGHWAHLRSK